DLEALRRAAGAGVRSVAGQARAALALPAGTADEAEAVALGGLLGAYAFSRYRTDGDQKAPVAELTVLSDQGDAVAERASVLAESVTLVRDLVNTPPSDLWPARFAELAEQAGGKAGLTVEVLD